MGYFIADRDLDHCHQPTEVRHLHDIALQNGHRQGDRCLDTDRLYDPHLQGMIIYSTTVYFITKMQCPKVWNEIYDVLILTF